MAESEFEIGLRYEAMHVSGDMLAITQSMNRGLYRVHSKQPMTIYILFTEMSE